MAAATIDPLLMGARAGLVAELAKRAPTYDRWREQVARAGYCERPVRLVGGVGHIDQQTGELRECFTTEHEPDGVVLTACGNRRAARCQPCSRVYQADAYQLVKAGLAGGKGMPESIGSHPRLFVTFTAPSFGPVHTRRAEGGTAHPCHPGRLGDRCAHGRRRACWHRHQEGDPDLGTPLCPDCYDYEAAVVWNALAPKLWKQTTITIGRALARRAGLTAKVCKRLVTPEFAKVAEYQARGAVHYHTIIRLDARPNADDPARVAPPPAWATVELLAAAVRDAAAVTVPGPVMDGRRLRIGWGVQLDLREITTSSFQAGELSAGQVAGYLAKYATKATEGLGAALDQPIRTERDLDDLTGRVPEHLARLARACWDLGCRPELARLHLRRWTHMLGYGGHFTTKSRRYSTTFPTLRRARVEHAARRHAGPAGSLDAWGRPLDQDAVVVLGSWQYAGRGYRNQGDAWLARSLGQQAREMRRIAREEVGALAS